MNVPRGRRGHGRVERARLHPARHYRPAVLARLDRPQDGSHGLREGLARALQGGGSSLINTGLL